MSKLKLLQMTVAICVASTACGTKNSGDSSVREAATEKKPSTDTVSFGGWTVRLLRVAKQSKPTYINDPTISFGEEKSASAGKKIIPNGMLWIVSLEATKSGAEDLPATDAAISDDSGHTFGAIAGGPANGSFWLKGMFINKPDSFALLFDVPADAKNPKLHLRSGSPAIDLSN